MLYNNNNSDSDSDSDSDSNNVFDHVLSMYGYF